MIPNPSDARLGVVCDVMPLSRTAALDAAESADGLHAVRATDSAAETCAGTAPVMAPWEVAWRRSLKIQRELQADLMAEIQRGQQLLGANTTYTEREARARRWERGETSLEL